nr:GntR family transcriptional regulator [Bradyrhizobium macuxiense]
MEREIALFYSVSRAPVRDAILRLANESLVKIFSQSRSAFWSTLRPPSTTIRSSWTGKANLAKLRSTRSPSYP